VSDLDIRVKRSLRALLDSTSPRYKRIIKSLKAFQGLDLGAISSDERSAIEGNIVKMNAVLEKYDLETFADYKKMSDTDLNLLIKNQAALCNDIKSFDKA
jgi:iron uptake system EfeUOB component EfeO/EfeM